MADIVQPNPIGSSRGRRTFVPSRVSLKRTALGLALMAGTAAVAHFGYSYWTVGQYLVSTDDAYVQADYTTVAPKVSGYLAEVLVKDNEPVKAGAVLARIDDRDFRTALDQAKADVAAAEAAVANFDAQIALQQSVIDRSPGGYRRRRRFAQIRRAGRRALPGLGEERHRHRCSAISRRPQA